MAPWATYIPVLVEGGATYYIKPMWMRLCEVPNLETVRERFSCRDCETIMQPPKRSLAAINDRHRMALFFKRESEFASDSPATNYNHVHSTLQIRSTVRAGMVRPGR